MLDRCLLQIRDRISVGWSINEAAAAGVGLGRSMAGQDCMVTMKIPGLFQAADVISSSAFFNEDRGALVYYVVSDYIPSSTQHLVDPRHFLASLKIPFLEPSSHQAMYEYPRVAADLSRQYKTPVVILAADTLAHAEGLIQTGPARTMPMMEPTDLTNWKNIPALVANNYKTAVQTRIPAVREFYENSGLVTEIPGDADFGIIVNGNGFYAVREVLSGLASKPSVLIVAGIYPLPNKSIKAFAEKFPKDKLVVIEDGDGYLKNQIELLLRTRLLGRKPGSPEVFLTPTSAANMLVDNNLIVKDPHVMPVPTLPPPVPRPPSNCPGCPYMAIEYILTRLKKYGEINAVFGDIGCSSLLSSLDTIVAMGVSDTMRQGFALSRPEDAVKNISIIGDSAEAHTGLNATRNAIFKGTPGVKIVLDNHTTAMTGGQTCPTSTNMNGEPTKFNLEEVLRAEGAFVVSADAYSVSGVYSALQNALLAAEKGHLAVLVLVGECIGIVDEAYKESNVTVDKDKCASCRNCEVCSGITYDDIDGTCDITPQCNNCGGAEIPVCAQLCPIQCSMVPEEVDAADDAKKLASSEPFSHEQYVRKEISTDILPQAIRLAIRGIGGQGNLFFGKALTEVFSRTPMIDTNIIKGDTHGMSQLGGPVLSMFSCGDVGSPVPQKGTVDVLVAMETSELLRPGFLELLKPGGTILVNRYARKPTFFKGNYPTLASIEKKLEGYKIIKVDASVISRSKLGDKTEKTANVVMLGALSTTAPFNCIPYENWIDALRNLSNSEKVLQSNCKAFQQGVDVGNSNYIDTDVQEILPIKRTMGMN